jgi:squalene synthase HpnC
MPPLPAHLIDLEPGCENLARARAHVAGLCRHYENFSLSSLFLPPRLRPALSSIYAFARFSDDLADETPPVQVAGLTLPELRRLRLEHWLELLDGLPTSAARHPILLALDEDARRHGLPLAECRRLLLAFLRDQDPPDYPDDAAVLAYCRDSAAPVGRLLLALNGLGEADAHYTRLAPLADALCAGLQLANFWQDLSRDLPAGRLYIPRDRLAAHGLPVDPARLPAAGPAFAPLLRELADWARVLLLKGRGLARHLPWRFALEVRLFAGGGLTVVERVERLGARILTERPVLTRRDRWRIALAACLPGETRR